MTATDLLHRREERDGGTRGGAGLRRGAGAGPGRADLLRRRAPHDVPVGGRRGHRARPADGGLVGVDLAAVRREVEDTIDFLRGEIGEEAWQAGMFPEAPAAEAAILDNPYQYTDFVDESKRAGGEDRVLGR